MKRTRNLVLSSLFAALVALMAQLSMPLPFSPVPITGQTFAVFLVGAILQSRWAATSMLIYVLLGAVGLPVFHNAQGGLHIVLGPTGGYLWGFVLGAYLLAAYVENRNTYFSMVAGMALCMLAIYSLGMLQLALITGLGFKEVFFLGTAPFIPGDIAKIIAASGLVLAVKRRLLNAGLMPGR